MSEPAVLQGTYNLPTVMLCLAADAAFSYAVLTLLVRVMRASGRRSAVAVLSGGAALGAGLWSLHFLAMLAYRTPFSIHYAPIPVLFSLALAVVVCAGAVFIMQQPGLSLYRWLGSGIAIGVGVCSTHYICMAAMETAYLIRFDLLFVCLSTLTAVTAAWITLMWVFYRNGAPLAGHPAVRLGGALCLAAALAGIHYLAMTGVTFIPPNMIRHADLPWLGPSSLALGMTIITLAVLIPLLAVVVYGRRNDGHQSFDNWLRASIVVGLTVAIGMVALSRWMVDRMQERELACYYLDEQLDRDVMQIKQWGSILGRPGAGPGIENRVEDELGEAIALADTGLKGGYEDGRYMTPIGDPFLRQKIRQYKSVLLRWQESIGRGGAAAARTLPALKLSSLSDDDVRDVDHLDRKLRLSLDTVDGIVIAILVAIFGSLYVINNRSRHLVSEKNRALRHALNEIESQRMAIDRHAIVSIKDTDGVITYVNDKFVEISGYSMGELVGDRHSILKTGQHADECYYGLWDTISRGEHWHGEMKKRKKDGSWYWTDTTIVPFLDDHGRPYKYIAISSDITRLKLAEHGLKELNEQLEERVEAKVRELKQAQDQLLQSEKLASIGQLAAGVAHEINNPVGYINSNIGTLKKYVHDICRLLDNYGKLEATCADRQMLAVLNKLKQDMDIEFVRHDLESLIEESQEGLTRVKQIVQDLKDFSHTDSGEWRECDIHTGLDRTLNIVHNEIKYKAEVIKDYGDLPPIECIPSQLNQVFMNLLVNGAQAIEKYGSITIRTGVDGDDRVWVQIADTGAGIPEDRVKRIFDPFFTTKPVGQGTGLGLALAYGIIKKHHGRIEVHSEVGRGSIFTVRLPVHRRDGVAGHAEPDAELAV